MEDQKKFLDYMRYELNRSELTVSAYELDIDQFIDFITGGKKETFQAASITTNDIRAWISHLSGRELSPVSIRRKTQSLRSFFRFIRKTYGTEINPASKITLAKKAKKLPEFVGADAIKEILSAYESETDFLTRRNLLALEILFCTGMRRDEIRKITDKDIDFHTKEIKVTGKRNKQRIIPIDKNLSEKIKDFLAARDERYAGSEYLFPGRGGAMMSPRNMENMIKKMLAGSGSSKKSPHVLRHSFATAMIQDGAELNSVKELLGHSSIATTQIYTHVSINEIRKSYRKAHPRGKKDKLEGLK